MIVFTIKHFPNECLVWHLLSDIIRILEHQWTYLSGKICSTALKCLISVSQKALQMWSWRHYCRWTIDISSIFCMVKCNGHIADEEWRDVEIQNQTYDKCSVVTVPFVLSYHVELDCDITKFWHQHRYLSFPCRLYCRVILEQATI